MIPTKSVEQIEVLMAIDPQTGQRPYGALLDNVSLLTTGGSTFQRSGKNKSDDIIIETSTPARGNSDGIMAGFDLSPVHSHERSSAGRKPRKARSSRSSQSSPRKSSKSYLHVRSSGYGLTPSSGRKLTGESPRLKTKIDRNERKSPSLTWRARSVAKSLERNNNDITTHVTNDDVIHDDITAHVTNGDVIPDDITSDDVTEEAPHKLVSEISRLKTQNDEMNLENFKLTAKLNQLLTNNARNDSADPKNDSAVATLQKEVMEQERLLKGFQLENEKLYSEISGLKSEMKRSNSAMYDENLRLKHQVAILSEEISNKDLVLKEKEKVLIPYVCTACEGYVEEVGGLREKLVAMEGREGGWVRDRDLYERQAEVMRSKVIELERQLEVGNPRQDAKLEETVLNMTQQREKDESEILVLREWVAKLERQVREGGEEKVRAVRLLRDKFNHMRVDYQDRIDQLSNQLALIKTNNNFDVEFELKNLRMENRELKKRIKQQNDKPGSKYNPEYFSIQNQENQQKQLENQQTQMNPQVDDINRKKLQEFEAEIEKLKQNIQEMTGHSEVVRFKYDQTIETMKNNYDVIMKKNEKKIKNLEEKIADLQSRLMTSQSAVVDACTKEAAMRNEVGKLLDELRLTRGGSPSVAMRRIQQLNQQIQVLNLKQQDRENWIKKMLGNTADDSAQVATLREVVAAKNLQLAKFRTELDSILGGIEEIKMR